MPDQHFVQIGLCSINKKSLPNTGHIYVSIGYCHLECAYTHLIALDFAAMKLMIIFIVLLALLDNPNLSDGLTTCRHLSNRMKFNLPMALVIAQPYLWCHQPRTKVASPILELHRPIRSEKPKVKVCRNGVILNNVK